MKTALVCAGKTADGFLTVTGVAAAAWYGYQAAPVLAIFAVAGAVLFRMVIAEPLARSILWWLAFCAVTAAALICGLRMAAERAWRWVNECEVTAEPDWDAEFWALICAEDKRDFSALGIAPEDWQMFVIGVRSIVRELRENERRQQS